MTRCKFIVNISSELKNQDLSNLSTIQEFKVSEVNGEQLVHYECPHVARVENGFCLFHDKNMTGDESKMPMFHEMVDNSIKKNIPLVCVGFNLSNLTLKDKEFKNSIYFISCTFYGNTLFMTVFKDILFIKNIFKRAVYFASKFIGKSEFRELVFEERALFLNGCNFEGSVYFNHIEFRSSFSIRFAKFKSKVDFIATTFENLADFANVYFHGETRFFNVEFKEQAEFSYTKFFKSVDFEYSYFATANFFRSEIYYDAGFTRTKFKERVTFDESKVVGLSVTKSEFLGEVHFSDARFPSLVELWLNWTNSDTIDESDLKFLMTKYFGIERIDQNINIEKADEKKLVISYPENNESFIFMKKFRKVEVYKNSKTNRISEDQFLLKRNNLNLYLYKRSNLTDDFKDIPVQFNYCTFQKKVIFEGKPERKLDLSLVSFKGVDLSNMEFHNVAFLQTIFRSIIVDEKFLPKRRNYEEVSRIYNQLRKNYESILAFNEASNFFVGEMDVTRQYLRSQSIRGKFTSLGYSLYKILALYGESPFLPLVIWTPIVILIFLQLRIYDACLVVHFNSCDVFDKLIDSISAFFQIPSGNSALDVMERIISAPILGAAFIAVRRRFERKK